MDDLSSIADIVSWNSSASLAFQDEKTAKQTLQALETQPSKVAAFLYTPEGKVFANYKTSYKEVTGFTPTKVLLLVDDKQQLPMAEPIQVTAVDKVLAACKQLMDRSTRHPVKSGYSDVIKYDQNDQMHILRPIIIDNELVGVLHLVDDQRGIKAFYSNFYLIIGGIVIITLFANLLISARLQRLFSEPLLHLMYAMRQVANDKKFTSQVKKIATMSLVSWWMFITKC